MEEFDINRVRLLVLTFLIFTLSSFVGSASTYTVAADGTGNYVTIQAAINNAASGDVVIVKPGTYTENVYINKTTLNDFILMSESGNPADTIITASNSGTSVIAVSYRSNITIKGFTISGAGTDQSGVYLLGSRNCTVENNAFVNDALGVFLRTSVNNIVRNNAITRTTDLGIGRGINVEQSSYATVSGNSISNTRYGIYFTNSAYGSVLGNTVSDSFTNGIVIDSSNNAVVESNTVKSSKDFGISLTKSNNDIVRNNVVSVSNNGINLVECTGNTISNNVGDSANHTIFMNQSHNNNLVGNTVSNSHYGIAMRYSNNNNITGNNAFNNNLATGDAGYYFTWTSSGNRISGNKANSNYNGFVVVNTANNNVLENNEANSNANFGIYLMSTNNNRLSGNKISQNARGISLLGLTTRENTISGNIINSNYGNGIHLENTSTNYIMGNSLDSNTGIGILLYNSNNTNIDKNKVLNSNDKGIYVIESSRDVISNNTATYNMKEGIMLSLADNNTIFRNMASNNNVGISFNSSVDNNASSNTLEWNGLHGMFLCARSTHNLVYNNNFFNVINANVKNAACNWYKERAAGKSVMGGPYVGGNYWAKPDITGHSQVTDDANGDGIADSPYTQENVVDNYPLVDYPDIQPVASFSTSINSGIAPLTVQFTDSSQYTTGWSWDFESDGIIDSTDKNTVHLYSNPGTYNAELTASNENGTDTNTVAINVQTPAVLLPVADFSASATSGDAPLAVQFTDISQNAVAWSWNFGDGSTSAAKSPAHTFNSAGTYTVSLVAGNENGISPTPKTATITVTTASSSGGGSSGGSHGSSGSSSGGSGGGGGGSPESSKNVKVKELCQVFITSGKAVKFDFTNNATAIVNLNFDSKKTVGKTTTIVEMLKNKSTLTPETPEGEVYNYLNIWVGNGGYGSDEDNLENAVINFRVEKSWVQDKGIDQSSIVLNRYNEKKWNELPTTLSGEDDTYLYFKAEAPGFSPFAITGESTAKETVTETQPETEENEENTGSTAANTEQESENKQETSTPEKTSSAPGFELIYGVAGLLSVFLHKRK